VRILLVAEGKHERGTLDRHGALEALVRRLLNREADFVHDRLANNQIHAHHGKGRGYYKKALRWMLEAAKRGFDAIVLVVDQDGAAERRRDIDDAQESPIASIRRALGVAIRRFDAWLLADEQALSGVLGMTVQRQPQIERIRDPKKTCKGLREASQRPMTQTEMYEGVAGQADLDILSERSPRGFAPFAERVRAL
jgi:hypothetical protein